MVSVLPYGNQNTIELELPADRLIAEFPGPRGTPIRDPAAAVAADLRHPIEFPPLSQATVPGDRVALALDANVPRHTAIVAGIVQTLLDCGIRPSDIAIVQPAAHPRRPRPDPRGDLPDAVAGEVQLVVHDPHDRQQLAYLAASKAGCPVYLNRALCDAELVVPVRCLRPTQSSGLHSNHASLFPAFSDQETIDRFQQADGAQAAADRRPWIEEIDQVGWLLGVAIAIATVPAAAGEVLHILPGEVGAVHCQGQTLANAAWGFQVPHRVGLVVASIGGNCGEPAWHDIARGLTAADSVMADDGAMVICTDLNTPPGPALRRIGDAADLDLVLADVLRDMPADAGTAVELIRILMRGRVFLMSDLQAGLVETTGMTPIADETEIGRLARQYPSCVLLNHAEFVVAKTLDDT